MRREARTTYREASVEWENAQNAVEREAGHQQVEILHVWPRSLDLGSNKVGVIVRF